MKGNQTFGIGKIFCPNVPERFMTNEYNKKDRCYIIISSISKTLFIYSSRTILQNKFRPYFITFIFYKVRMRLNSHLLQIN